MTDVIMLIAGYAIFGIISLMFGYAVRVKKRADFIHSEPARVLTDVPAFCNQVGSAVIVMGICLMMAAVFMYFNFGLYSSVSALIGIIFVAFQVILAEKKYRR